MLDPRIEIAVRNALVKIAQPETEHDWKLVRNAEYRILKRLRSGEKPEDLVFAEETRNIYRSAQAKKQIGHSS